ncbi:coiled-coil domain-containing protein 180 isoform X2 [Scyliorhinus canicula]|uniref:coiled-coil domain-containing protein 180 isoform X2 n=1 Tax=Scyliorhinus canicula TaxID=7830 RepID=UPI0018F5B75D|nr:coiled-coil domain-containing protein 180 isoform X2 [Scyliorhinus canicula]
MGEVRVVPSGKVYRQIFDAEVQLVRTLGETRRKSQHHGAPFDSGGIPIIRNLDTPTGQVISHRQRLWMEGLLNDGFTENPVLHRDAVLSAIKPKEVVELNNAVMEVKGLPDVIIPTKIGSSIIEQLMANKQEKHEATIMKLEEDLAMISEDLEIRFIETAKHLLYEVGVSYQTDQELWLKADNISENSELTLEITAAFKECMEALDRIAFIPSGDIHRFIDKEAMLVNQALLANQRAMKKLNVNLMEADLMQEMSERGKYDTKVHELNASKKNEILQKFKDYLAKDWNAGLAMEKETLIKEQQKLNAKRIQRLEDIVIMKPFDINKSTMAEWYDSVQILNQEIDSVNIQYASKLHAFHENLYHDWMTEIDNAEEMLVSLGVCTKEEAKQLITTDFLPIIGNLQRRFEEEHSTVDKHMENLAHRMDLQCKVLYNICKEATQLWDGHQLNLAEQENILKEQLDDCRRKHDKANQTKEANLDQLIDQLRQRNTEMELKSDHKKAIYMLDLIKKGYTSFYQKQLKIVHNYPVMSGKELHRFSSAISKCFNAVEIYKPNKPKITVEIPSEVVSPIEVTIAYSEASDMTAESKESQSIREEATEHSTIIDKLSEDEAEASGQELGSHIQGLSLESIHTQKKDGESRNTSNRSDLEPSPFNSQHLSEDGSEEKMETFLPTMQIDAEETESYEYFRSSRGNTYSVICDEIHSKSMISLLKAEEQKHALDYMIHAFIPDPTFQDLKKRIRLNFFDLLENWYDEAIGNAKNIATIKKKEFKAELELRMHLHEPRGKRIKVDVLHVRAVELRLHMEKVERHCKGVDKVLKELTNNFKGLQSEHCKAILNFRDSIYNMEEIFKTANKSDRLVTLLNSLHAKQDKYMESVDRLLRNFQNTMDKSLSQLQDDNAQFITSFRLFAEGGNYTPHEIGLYNEKVEQTATNIAKTEGAIMVDLELMEALSLEQSTGVIKEVEDKFMRYTLDLMFIEKMKRFLTNSQTRIKTEAAVSNRQTLDITSHLEQLEKKIDACARPNLDKEFVLPEELYRFAKVIRDLTEKRAIYLKCLVEPVLGTKEALLQGPIVTATHVEFHTHENKINENKINEHLLIPTRKGKAIVDDVVVGVIKDLLLTHKAEIQSETEGELTDEQSTIRGSRISSLSGSQNARTPGVSSRVPKTASTPSAVKHSKVNRFDPKYQVFEETEEAPDHFNGIIKLILWENCNALLAAAEEYYKKKDRHPVYRPAYLRDTFEQCADELIQKMLSYQAQANDYHNNCLQEFRQQLKVFETSVASIPPFLINDVLKKQMDFISKALAEKRSTFRKKLQQLENIKTENKHRLRPTLGLPENLELLESLCKEEEKRQEAEVAVINSKAEDLKKCMLENAEGFVAALASLSEKLLLEFDSFLTVDNVQRPQAESVMEMIRQKRVGVQPQEGEGSSATETPRETRTSWPGIPANELSQMRKESIVKGTASTATLSMETAAVTTAKIVQADLTTVEARDSAYMTYKEYFLKEMSQIECETNGQLMNAQHWQHGWRDSIANIKKLYSLVRVGCIMPSPVLDT